MTDGSETDDERIDQFVEATRAMAEETDILEGPPWNTGLSADQARIFANGVGDVNPRWDPDGPGSEGHPLYLTTVRYPQLHGEPMDVPLSSFVADVTYEWHAPIEIGDDIDAAATVDAVSEKERGDRRYVFVESETTYDRAATGERLATAGATQLFVTETGSTYRDRDVHGYTEAERATIEAAYGAELDRLEAIPETPDPDGVAPGDELPTLVRGPLTIADMVCWQSTAPPTYGSSIVNYVQRTANPHNTVTNPLTGWPQKSSHQHEDVWLCEQRGMPLPFGNGIMMYAWTALPVTNWLGADGHLRRHEGAIQAPLFYGDTLWVDATVTGVEPADGGEGATVALEWVATNQREETVLDGSSEVRLPGVDA